MPCLETAKVSKIKYFFIHFIVQNDEYYDFSPKNNTFAK